ncbi:hypothetical protein BGY98DRAFT_955743 [Russula aff. rugulosa BPL654]|nr:hypothetical protein BGY98DRAFT_955743 [Russula aff. rugulosa BPL654]
MHAPNCFFPFNSTFLYSTRNLQPCTSKPFKAATTASAPVARRKLAKARPQKEPD